MEQIKKEYASKASRYEIITLNKLENADIPIDKINRNAWYFDKVIEGQQRYLFDVGKKGEKQPINLKYSIDFFALDKLDGNVKITKKLEPYDRRVYIAMGGLFKNSPYMTIQQIYNAMGFTTYERHRRT